MMLRVWRAVAALIALPGLVLAQTPQRVSAPDTHAPTALMATGYRNYFLKLRLDWLEGSTVSEATVDRFIQTLVGAIVRQTARAG